MPTYYDEDGHEAAEPEVDFFDSEPSPDDWVTTDHRTFRERETGRVVVTVPDGATTAEMWEHLNAAMDRAKFWPSVWFVSDHGNYHMMGE